VDAVAGAFDAVVTRDAVVTCDAVVTRDRAGTAVVGAAVDDGAAAAVVGAATPAADGAAGVVGAGTAGTWRAAGFGAADAWPGRTSARPARTAMATSRGRLMRAPRMRWRGRCPVSAVRRAAGSGRRGARWCMGEDSRSGIG
jgi:hypothetical protein